MGYDLRLCKYIINIQKNVLPLEATHKDLFKFWNLKH